jgi:uncharacterized membrane protein YhaH (DUF805 family)
MREVFLCYFSISGRLGHASFLKLWLKRVIALLAVVVVAVFLSIQGLLLADYLAIIPFVGIFISTYTLFIRRLHDRGLSGWLLVLSVMIGAFAHLVENSRSAPILLLLLALVLIQFWLFVEIFFRRGKVGSNRYGPDPLA